MKYFICFLFVFSALLAHEPKKSPAKAVKVGADILFSQRNDLIDGKRVAVVTNHTGVLSNGTHIVDALYNYKNTTLIEIFGPEHGVRGDNPDGTQIHDSVDTNTGVKTISLYGKINKPTPEMLKNVDVLIYDIQDVGARFYTYISTMFLCMEACAENNVHFVVLDRPNPITGEDIEGPVRLDSLKTFVGWAPLPVLYGATIGELAILANTSGWLKNREQAKLTVVKMENWKRSMYYDETKLPWIKPSPNMPTLETAIVYPGTCLIEGTNISEGRGSEKPFEYIGAPWIKGKELALLLNKQELPGVRFESVEFTPVQIPNVTTNPKYKDQHCEGVYVRVTNRDQYEAVRTGLTIVWAVNKLYPDSLTFRERGFDRLMGTPVPRQMILEGKSVLDIMPLWDDELDAFRKLRRKGLLY